MKKRKGRKFRFAKKDLNKRGGLNFKRPFREVMRSGYRVSGIKYRSGFD